MPFQSSAGVVTSEIDLTTVVPSTGTSTGAFAGAFQWGPVNFATAVANETKLVELFGKPDSNTAMSFWTAANFLSYGSDLRISRAASVNTTISTSYSAAGAVVTNATTGGSAFVTIPNPDVYFSTYYNSNTASLGAFTAKYPGAKGSSLRVHVFASNNQSNFDGWVYKNYFDSKPGTSAYATARGSANDEMHIVVIDGNGEFGTTNTVLEVFPFVSKASDAKDDTGTSIYYRDVLFNRSKYVYWTDHPSIASTAATWGKPCSQVQSPVSYAEIGTNITTLVNGFDAPVTDGNLITAYGQFLDPEKIDISLVPTANYSANVSQYVLDNITGGRKDCVAFISPPLSNVQAAVPATSISDWKNNTLNRSTSYGIMDSGWKYQYDKYNDIYRWVPLNGDIAGLCVRTDQVRDPWFSPAGMSRGAIKNVVKLAWNPNKSERDIIYKNGINPVVSFTGEGVVLYGDKTMLNKPSAFDRINVRRLFITVEKAISIASRSSLFEFNDEFTRNQFVSIIEPFLRNVKARRGIYDFRVVCDETNNTSEVIDRNEFVGDIYIKPARSINYIQLNFVAVRSGVAFDEVVGKF